MDEFDVDQIQIIQRVLDIHLTEAESIIAFGLLESKSVEDIEFMLVEMFGISPSSDSIRLAHKPHVLELMSQFVWRESVDGKELYVKIKGLLTEKRLEVIPLLESRRSIADIACKLGLNYESIRTRVVRSIEILSNSDDKTLQRYGEFLRFIHRNRPLILTRSVVEL